MDSFARWLWDGSYHAQVVIGNGGVVQTLSSAGVVPGDLRGVDYQLATCTGCGQWYRPRPPASQSIDRGEALTIQLELPTRCRIYQKCICCSWPEESVRLSRGGGGGFSLVTPPSFYAKCGRAADCWFFAIDVIGTCGLLSMCRLLCCGINESASYVAYDAAGTPLGGARFVVEDHHTCCGTINKSWLDLGATPVAARRDLVAAVVALKSTNAAAHFILGKWVEMAWA